LPLPTGVTSFCWYFVANPLKCSVCDAVATVHLTQIVQGKVTKVDFCEACAAKGGAGDAAVFKLADAVNAVTPAPAITCPQCGFTDVEFRRRGRLGCPSCWQVFGVALGGLLTKVQHEIQHVGRAPAGTVPVGQLRHRLLAAQLELTAAIAAEDYETAAKLRDEVARITTQLDTL
jgi:protein arginine kinase activator